MLHCLAVESGKAWEDRADRAIRLPRYSRAPHRRELLDLVGLRVNGVVERFGQLTRELCMRSLISFDRLASIEVGARHTPGIFLSPALEVARLERQHCLLHDLLVH